MLKKMLRYDFKAILKFWWIGVITTLVLSLGAGYCGHLLYTDKEFPEIINVMSVFIIVIAVISLVAFVFATNILIYVRFYKHLFSDEGYLTFTLPVKRTQLLNSKIIAGTTVSFVTMAITFLEIIAGFAIALKSEAESFYNEVLVDIIHDLQTDNELVIGLIILAIFGLILAILITVASVMFTYLCITIGSVITRKNKVISAIGVYYAANAVLTFIIQIMYLFGFTSISQVLNGLPEDSLDPIVSVGLFIPVLFVGTICAIFYALNYWLIDKKLNLS